MIEEALPIPTPGGLPDNQAHIQDAHKGPHRKAKKNPGPTASPAPQQVPESIPLPLDPAYPSPKNSSPFGNVDQILASMDWANIAFNSPAKIKLNRTAQIQLLLSLQKPMDELRAAITATEGERVGARVRVLSRMDAHLSSPDFQITAITPEEQAIGSIDVNEWKWEIKPTTPGRHSLHLALMALFSVDGAATRHAVRTFDKTIEVEISAGDWASTFIGKNWQWLWVTVLLPVGGWLWKRRKVAIEYFRAQQ